MHTIFMTVALITAAPSAAWNSSYSHGQQQAEAQNKPMVVVFAPRASGWTKIVRGENPSLELGKILAEQYVCVFVDTSSDCGKQLAQDFAIAGDTGLVISDRKGGTQAFWHQGDMPNDNVLHYLAKYADPDIVVHRTETVAPPRPTYFNQPSFSPTIPTRNC